MSAHDRSRKSGRVMFIAGAVLVANLMFSVTSKAYARDTEPGRCPDPVQTCTSAEPDCTNASYPTCNLCFLTSIFTTKPCIYNGP